MSASPALAIQQHSPTVRENPEPKEVLTELLLLLEEFAPSWYTEDHHKRALAALKIQ